MTRFSCFVTRSGRICKTSLTWVTLFEGILSNRGELVEGSEMDPMLGVSDPSVADLIPPPTFSGEIRPKICCFFESLADNYFTFYASHSADKFSNVQQIFGLCKRNASFKSSCHLIPS